MGKSRPRNRNRNRAHPAAKQIKPPSDPELLAIREQRIVPVLKDLQSADLKTRSSAARAITNIVEDPKSRKLLLREQIVRILFEQTLTDSSLETRTDGWGILRNLALEEESDFCIHLYRQDVLTAIENVIKTIVQTIEAQNVPFSKLPRPQQDLAWKLTSSIVSLLTSLSEAQDEIVEAITQSSTIVDFLPGLLAFEATPDVVKIEVLSCLTALTEDNKEFSQHIVDNHWATLRLKDADDLFSIATCAVLHNIFVALQWFDHNTPQEGCSDAALLPVLVRCMDKAASTSNGSTGDLSVEERSSPDQILQQALEITAAIATSLQEALEHSAQNEKPFEGFGHEATNGEDEDMDPDADLNEDEGTKGDDDSELNDEQIEADMALVTGEDSDDDTPSQEVTLDRLVRLAAPNILSLVNTTPQGSVLQGHALSALNNIAWTISSIDFSTGHLNPLQKFWAKLSQTIWNQIVTPVLSSNTADIELASTITSLAWAVSRSVKGVIDIQPEEHRKFMALYQASKGLNAPSLQENGERKSSEDFDQFQGLGVKCIGVLGSLALDPAPIELNREIGIFLLTVLSALPDAPAADTVEALNQLFDIYADKAYAFDEPVFWGDNFYKHIEDIQPKVKKLAKGIDKRKFGELRARADEAILNLGRFLVYKRKEKAGKN